MEFDLSLVGFFHKVQERSKAYDEELKLKQQEEEMKNAEISEEEQTILDMYYESLHRPQILEIKSKAENDNASSDGYDTNYDNLTNNDDSLNENDVSNNDNALNKEVPTAEIFVTKDIPTTPRIS